MKKNIVCLGDSNTHGYCADPEDSADGTVMRFNEEERWPCLLQNMLGEEYFVHEEGLSGRTAVFQDPLYEGLCAIDYLNPCLMSHEPVSLLVVMLGTNDTKERFGANAECISLGIERLLRKAMSTEYWAGGKPNILLVAPPVIDPRMETSAVGGCMGKGCAAKSEELPHFLKATAALLQVGFLSAADCPCNHIDYMHLTKEGHRLLAERLAARIRSM